MEENRSERLHVRIRPSVKDLAEKKAKEESRTLSNYIESIIVKDCERNLEGDSMLRFHYHDEDNMREAVNEYCAYEKTPGRWIVASASLYSSEGNEYIVDKDFDHKPTRDDLTTLANEDWAEFYQGVLPDAEERKEEIIEQLLGEYIIVDRESFTRTKAEMGCDE